MTMLELTPDDVYERLVTSGNLAIVVGRRGSGKTAFGFHLCEKAKDNDKRPYIVGFPEEARKHIPQYIEIVNNLKDVPNGSFALLDEAIIQYNARKWRSSKNMSLTEIADLARHKDLSVVFIAINTAMLDPNVLRTIDTLVLKEPSLLQEHMERPFLKKFLQKVGKAMKDIPIGEKMKYAYVFDDRLEGLVKTDLPSFWSDDLSKSWKDYTSPTEGGKKEGIKVIGAASMPMGMAPICFDCGFFVHTQYEAWCSKGLDVGVTECDSFTEKKTPKVYSWKERKDPSKSPPWKKNPPEGTEQCIGCGNFEGETETGMMCKHFQKPVKFLETACDYRISKNLFENPRGQVDEAKRLAYKKKLENAVDVYVKFRQPFTSPDGSTSSFWEPWLQSLSRSKYKFVSGESAGTDKYFIPSVNGNRSFQVLVHQGYKSWQRGQPIYTKYPMSCNCKGWVFRKICKHCEDLAEMILEFASGNAIQPTEMPLPTSDEESPRELVQRIAEDVLLGRPLNMADVPLDSKPMVEGRIGSSLLCTNNTTVEGGSNFGESKVTNMITILEKGKWYPFTLNMQELSSQVRLIPFNLENGCVYSTAVLIKILTWKDDDSNWWVKILEIQGDAEYKSDGKNHVARKSDLEHVIMLPLSPMAYLEEYVGTQFLPMPVDPKPESFWSYSAIFTLGDLDFYEDNKTLLYPVKFDSLYVLPIDFKMAFSRDASHLKLYVPYLFYSPRGSCVSSWEVLWNAETSIGYKIKVGSDRKAVDLQMFGEADLDKICCAPMKSWEGYL